MLTDPELDARFDAALAAGAQTREGELDLDRLLNSRPRRTPFWRRQGRDVQSEAAPKSGRGARTLGAMNATKAVLLDFYGTVARATHWVSADEVLAEHGYKLPPDAYERWFNDGIDGIEHDEHSQSRDHYVAWQRERTLAMLAETDVHPGEYEEILEKLRAGSATRVIEAYDEVADVSRRCGPRAAPRDLLELGLGSARGGRGGRPHRARSTRSSRRPGSGPASPTRGSTPRRLAEAGVEPAEALFVGDTWGPDVEGPLAAGIRAVYLRRDGHWPDGTCPHDDRAATGAGAPRPPGLLDLVEGAAVP